MRPKRTFSTLWTIISSVCTPTAPGYSAILTPLRPSAEAAALAMAVKPVVVTTTPGIPSFSASTAGLTEAGVHVPHPPLPVMIASQPLSFASAAISFAIFFCETASPPT